MTCECLDHHWSHVSAILAPKRVQGTLSGCLSCKFMASHMYANNLCILLLAFHHSVNGQKWVRAHVMLFYYFQANYQIPIKKSVKIKYCPASALYDILKIYPRNADYFAFFHLK